MAMNPKWCKSISHWKNHFTEWVTTSEPQDLLEINIFFDYRSIYGDKHIVYDLTNHINILLKNNPSFFLHMTQNALLYKPPVNLFGNIVIESNNESFDIKSAIVPMVNVARIYALKHEIVDKNTIERLTSLYELEKFNKKDYEDIKQSYNYLMNIRFRHQSDMFIKKDTANNLINSKSLTEFETAVIKKSFSQISHLLTKLSFDFLGKA